MELNELRKTAEAATPGPWFAFDRGIGYEVHHASGYELNNGHRETFTESDATHIAAFDPPTVLALLSRLEQAEQAVARVEQLSNRLDREGCQLGTVIRIQQALEGDPHE